MRVQSASRWREGQLMVHMALMCALTQWGLWRFWLRHTYIAFFPDEAVNHHFSIASWIGGAFMCMTTGAFIATCTMAQTQVQTPSRSLAT